MRALLLCVAVASSMFAACGGKAEPTAPAEPRPSAPAESTAPGGVPGTPDQCCCELPDARGMQLSSTAECAATAGTCTPVVDCNNSDEHAR